MSQVAKLLSISILAGCILISGGYAAGQQTVASQSKVVPGAKPKVAQGVAGPSDKVANQLAQVQEQLKQLQDSIEAMRSEQKLMDVGIESALRSSAQNGLDLAELTHSVSENRKIIDLIDRQVDLTASGVGMLLDSTAKLLDRTYTLPSDLQKIKTRLGLY